MPWVQRGLALAAALVAGCLAWQGWWPFNTSPTPVDTVEDPSAWQYLLGDRYVLGFVRLALVALALYFFASVPALIAAARWAKGFGTTGITADEAQRASKTLEEYEKELSDRDAKIQAATQTIEQYQEQRNAALRLLRTLTSTTTSTPPSSTSPQTSPIVSEEENDDGDTDQRDAREAEPGGEADRPEG